MVEGAGAVGSPRCSAARRRPPAAGTTVVVLSGGNVDAGLLAGRRAAARDARRAAGWCCARASPTARARSRAADAVAETGANIVDVEHMREGYDLHVRETGVQIVVETRGADHAQAILTTVAQAGYDVGGAAQLRS